MMWNMITFQSWASHKSLTKESQIQMKNDWTENDKLLRVCVFMFLWSMFFYFFMCNWHCKANIHIEGSQGHPLVCSTSLNMTGKMCHDFNAQHKTIWFSCNNHPIVTLWSADIFLGFNIIRFRVGFFVCLFFYHKWRIVQLQKYLMRLSTLY